MAVNTTGITPAAQFLETHWARETSDAVKAELVLLDLVDRSYEADANGARVVRINDRSNPGVRLKTEDASATWANIAETAQDITINRHAYTGFLIEDIAEIQSRIEIRQGYTDDSGYSLVAFIEGDATSGMASLPANFSQSVGTLGSDPSLDDLIAALTLLDNADAKRAGRFLYASPPLHSALLKQDAFTRQEYVGQGDAEKAIKEAEVGRVFGAKVYVSTLANNAPAAANQSYGWFCHKRGVAAILQRDVTVHTDYVQLEFAWGVTVDVIYQFAERLIAPKTLGGGTSVDTHNVSIAAA